MLQRLQEGVMDKQYTYQTCYSWQCSATQSKRLSRQEASYWQTLSTTLLARRLDFRSTSRKVWAASSSRPRSPLRSSKQLMLVSSHSFSVGSVSGLPLTLVQTSQWQFWVLFSYLRQLKNLGSRSMNFLKLRWLMVRLAWTVSTMRLAEMTELRALTASQLRLTRLKKAQEQGRRQLRIILKPERVQISSMLTQDLATRVRMFLVGEAKRPCRSFVLLSMTGQQGSQGYRFSLKLKVDSPCGSSSYNLLVSSCSPCRRFILKFSPSSGSSCLASSFFCTAGLWSCFSPLEGANWNSSSSSSSIPPASLFLFFPPLRPKCTRNILRHSATASGQHRSTQFMINLLQQLQEYQRVVLSLRISRRIYSWFDRIYCYQGARDRSWEAFLRIFSVLRRRSAISASWAILRSSKALRSSSAFCPTAQTGPDLGFFSMSWSTLKSALWQGPSSLSQSSFSILSLMMSPSSEESMDILLTKLISILEESLNSLLFLLRMLFFESLCCSCLEREDFREEATDCAFSESCSRLSRTSYWYLKDYSTRLALLLLQQSVEGGRNYISCSYLIYQLYCLGSGISFEKWICGRQSSKELMRCLRSASSWLEDYRQELERMLLSFLPRDYLNLLGVADFSSFLGEWILTYTLILELSTAPFWGLRLRSLRRSNQYLMASLICDSLAYYYDLSSAQNSLVPGSSSQVISMFSWGMGCRSTLLAALSLDLEVLISSLWQLPCSSLEGDCLYNSLMILSSNFLMVFWFYNSSRLLYLWVSSVLLRGRGSCFSIREGRGLLPFSFFFMRIISLKFMRWLRAGASLWGSGGGWFSGCLVIQFMMELYFCRQQLVSISFWTLSSCLCRSLLQPSIYYQIYHNHVLSFAIDYIGEA